MKAAYLRKQRLTLALAELVPGTLLRYFVSNALKFSDGTHGDLEILGIVVWHKCLTRGDKRHVVAVVWDHNASETYMVYNNDLSQFVSVVQTS